MLFKVCTSDLFARLEITKKTFNLSICSDKIFFVQDNIEIVQDNIEIVQDKNFKNLFFAFNTDSNYMFLV